MIANIMYVFKQFTKDHILWEMNAEDATFWNVRALEKIQYNNNIDCLSQTQHYDEETMKKLKEATDRMTRH